ncbi:MAG: hypothetical protein ACTS73_06090 [Arsenophonus sp. NEOnobi-MAG3]
MHKLICNSAWQLQLIATAVEAELEGICYNMLKRRLLNSHQYAIVRNGYLLQRTNTD